MASSTKKTRHTYVFEFDEQELKVLSNVFYRVQMSHRGPGNIASGIASEFEKYCYVDEYDSEGRPNYIKMYHPPEDEYNVGPALYWEPGK